MMNKLCARQDCDEIFTPKAHNGIYHSEECRRIATNAKVLQRYYDKKKQKTNKRRICKSKGCDTILSKYNKEEICEYHKTDRLRKRLKKWGWSKEQIDKQVEAL